MSASVADRMEEGIRAYTRGDTEEARRCWNDVLALDPRNGRARAYLAVLSGAADRRAAAAAAATAGATAPPPATPAAATAGAAAPPPATPAAAPSGAAVGAGAGAAEASPWDVGPASAPAVVLGEGDGLDLVSVERGAEVPSLVPDRAAEPQARNAATDVDVWMQGARELFALGDFSGSLEMIEKILTVAPSHTEAREYLRQNEATLVAMYESKLGSLAARPRLAIKPEEVMWLNLDHRAGFLLAQIDGTVSYDDLFALSGLPRLDTARILSAFLQEGVISS